MSTSEAVENSGAPVVVPQAASSSSHVHSEAVLEEPRFGRRAGAPRDTINIAFKDSQYPTPYTDQSVPGDRPGHKERHLGRDYAPYPLTRSHMNNALVVPFVEGVSSPGYSEGTNASFAPAALYVLNSKNNGKRHFDEGRGTESPWMPAKRYMPPPGTHAAEQANGTKAALHRRGLGVYNLECGAGLHPSAAEALERRRVKGEAEFRGGRGKAMVEKPRDHSVFHLGLAHTVFGEAGSQTAPTATTGTPAVDAVTSSATNESPCVPSPSSPQPPTSASGTGAVVAEREEATRYVNNGFVFSSAYADESLAIASVPYVGSVRPHQDAPDYLVERQARAQWQATQKSRGVAVKLSDDVRAVRQLPDW